MSTTSSQAAAGNPQDGSSPRKVLRLVEALCQAAEPLRLAELAARTGMAKPTAHRLLGVLVADGWAAAHEGGRYGVGPALDAIAAAVSRDRRHESVEEILEELRRKVRQTVHMGLRAGDHVVYTAKVEGPQPLAMASRVGMQQPLHSTAIGKCILAAVDERELGEIARRTALEKRTEHTLTTLDALAGDLAEIRHRGYALDDEENEANIRCLAVPVVAADGRTIGAVSVSTVTFVTAREELLAFHGDVRDAARLLARTLSP